MAHQCSLLLVPILFLLSVGVSHGQEKKLEPLNISYPSVTGNMAPLWIAKEMGLYEKNGLDAKLVNIASGTVSVNALIAGDIHIGAASGSSAVAAAGRGAPLVILATFGPTPYKLVAHPSITSIQELKGKIIGSSRPGAGSDFALRRLLRKLGLTPGKDVTILATGLSESDKRILVMLQGKIDATLGGEDNVLQFELRGQKLSVLAGLLEMGLYTSGSVLTTTRQFLKNYPYRVKAMLKAFSEGIWIGRTNKEVAFQIYRKYMRVDDPRLLEITYKTTLLNRIPPKPYPREEAVQSDIEDLSATTPQLKGMKPSDFMDVSILKEIESEGFFARLHGY